MPKTKIYLDNNATTPLHPRVRKKMINTMDVFGNPSSLHQFGREARSLIQNARRDIADFINADPDEIIFAGSGSEANNTVLSMLTCPSKPCTIRSEQKPHVITTEIEHPCILETASCINQTAEVDYLGVDELGKIDLKELKRKLKNNTILVSVMMANNEIGTIQEIKKITEIVKQHGSLMHTDAVQAVGKLPADVKDLDVDYLSMSAHKIYGPKGIGALYIKNGAPFCPFIRGGHQEKGRRAGTENTMGIIGFGEAIRLRKEEMLSEEKRLKKLRQKLKTGLENNIKKIKFIGDQEDTLPNTLNVAFYGVEGESILLYLDNAGIAVSTGSACSSGSTKPSHVISATGLEQEYIHGSIRISMGRNTTEEDIDYTIETFTKVIQKLRSFTTFNNETEK
ncbi:MAG: cysteine desulfurase [Candidatus Marinimicrobia bacterium]|nr:cysteine desulfurase [Candidatus Neomarinimicrobiota bacterium]